MTSFRNEKHSKLEGAYRVPATVRWPGATKADFVSNDIVSHLGWAPILLVAVGVPDVKEKLLQGTRSAPQRIQCTCTATTSYPI